MSNIITPSDTNDIIVKPKIVSADIKRLTTANGLGTVGPNVKIGDVFYLDMHSLASVKITLANGVEFIAPILWRVDGMGKQLGWMYAELFFPSLNAPLVDDVR